MESQPGKGSTITSLGAVVDASSPGWEKTTVGGQRSIVPVKHPGSVVGNDGIGGVAGRRTRLKLSAHVDTVGPARQQNPEVSHGGGGEGLNGRHPEQRGDNRGGAPHSARISPQPLGSQGEDASCDAEAGNLPHDQRHEGGEDEAGPCPTRGRGGGGGGGGVDGGEGKLASGSVGACNKDCDTMTHAYADGGGVGGNDQSDGDGSQHVVASQMSIVEILTQTQQQQRQCDDDGGGVATSRRNACVPASPSNSSFGCSSSRSSIKACIVCGADLSSMSVSQQEVHINACLDGTAASADTVARSSGGESSSRLGKGTEADAGGMANCMVCGKVLAGMSPQGMQAHLNACLDQGASRSGGSSKGGRSSEKDRVERAASGGNDAAKLSSGPEQADMQVCAGEGAGEQGDEEMGTVECGICGMDMSKMGTSWRIKHVNECCDASSQAKRVSGIGSQALAECSLCGRDMSGWDADYRSEHVNDCCDMDARKKQARENARDFRREAPGKGVAGKKRGLEEGEKSEVGMLLARCGIERHAMLLEQAGITTIQALKELDEEALRALGLPVGARKRIAASFLTSAPAAPAAPRPAPVAPPPPASCPVLTRVANAKKPRRRAGKAGGQDGEGDEQRRQQQLLLAAGEGGGREALKLALALSASLKEGGGESLLGGSSAVARRLWQKERDAAAKRVVQGSASGDEVLREIFPSQGSPAERPPKLPVSRFLGKSRGKRLWSKGAARPPHDVESTLGFYTAILDVGRKGVAEGACLRRLAEGGDYSGVGGGEEGRGRMESGGRGAASGVQGAGDVAVHGEMCKEGEMMEEERRNPAFPGQANKEEEKMKGGGEKRVQEKVEEEEEEEEVVPDSEDEEASAMSRGGPEGDRGLLSQLVDIFDREDDEEDGDTDNVDDVDEQVSGLGEGGVGVGTAENEERLEVKMDARMDRDVDAVHGVAGRSDGVTLEAEADIGSEMEGDGDVDIVEAGSGCDEGDDIARELQDILEGIPEVERAAARERASHAACLLVEQFSSELAGVDAAEEEELARVRKRWVSRREEMKQGQAERLRHAVLAALVPESSQ